MATDSRVKQKVSSITNINQNMIWKLIIIFSIIPNKTENKINIVITYYLFTSYLHLNLGLSFILPYLLLKILNISPVYTKYEILDSNWVGSLSVRRCVKRKHMIVIKKKVLNRIS